MLSLSLRIKLSSISLIYLVKRHVFFKTNNVFASIRYWHFIIMYSKVNTLFFNFYFMILDSKI